MDPFPFSKDSLLGAIIADKKWFQLTKEMTIFFHFFHFLPVANFIKLFTAVNY
jgi:hypothetical protein